MIIFKNFLRSFLKNKTYTFSIVVLITFIGFVFSLFTHSTLSLFTKLENDPQFAYVEQFHFSPKISVSQEQFSDLVKKYNISQEDFHSLSQEELIKKYNIDITKYELNEITQLAQTHHFSFEKYTYKSFKQKDTLFIATTYNGTISSNYFTEGTAPTNSNELAIGVGYAQSHNLILGQSIQIEDKSYIITGFFYDYGNTFIYDPQLSKTVFAKDNTKILLTHESYNILSHNENKTYLGIFTDKNDIEKQFENTRNDSKFATIEKVGDSVKLFNLTLQSQKSIIYIGITIILSVTLIFTFLFMNNHLSEVKKQYGLLLAMGYRKKQIITPYILTPFITVIFLTLGIVLGFTFQNILVDQFKNLFNYPFPPSNFNWYASAQFIFYFTFIFTLFFIYKIIVLLHSDPKVLISGAKQVKESNRHHFLLSLCEKLPFKQRIQSKFAFSSLSKILTLLVVSFISTTLIIIALSLNSAQTHSIITLETQTSYNEIVFFDSIKQSTDNDKSHFLSLPAFFIQDNKRESVTIQFIDFSTSYIHFDINENDGVILPIKYKILNGYHQGDTIKIENNDTTVSLKIIGFSDMTESATLYVSYNTILKYNNKMTTNSYNGLYLRENQSPPNDTHHIIKKSEQIQLMQDLKRNSSTLILILILFSTISAFALISILTSINIKNNDKSIMLLLISGYKENDITKLILNIYSIFIIIGIILSGLISPIILDAFTKIINTPGNLFLFVTMSLFDYIIAALLIISLYFFTLHFEKAKLKKLNIRKILDSE